MYTGILSRVVTSKECRTVLVIGHMQEGMFRDVGSGQELQAGAGSGPMCASSWNMKGAS